MKDSKQTLKIPEESVMKILDYKPNKAPTKPERQPTMDELNQTFRYQDGKIIGLDSFNEFDNEIN